jgi:hypothetical protein
VFFDPFEEYVIVPEETRQKWVFPPFFSCTVVTSLGPLLIIGI